MKIEQIAFAVKDTNVFMNLLRQVLGAKNWVHDDVTAKGDVFGLPAENTAELHFNYECGFELEVLKYKEGPNWHVNRLEHKIGADVFISHMGLHVDQEEMDRIKEVMRGLNVRIAQEVYTQSHTNEVIKGKRQYHYVVFDSHAVIGFDLKLIRRIIL